MLSQLDFLCFTTASLALPISYLLFIYAAFDPKKQRNHIKNVRLRFVGALANTFISVCITFWLLNKTKNELNLPPFQEMGFRTDNIVFAMLFPTLLTSIFYLGTFLSMFFDGNLSDFLDLKAWRESFLDIYWIRSAVMAPITEEITFRACSATLFKQCFGQTATIFVSPAFFAICHFHHVFEDRRLDLSLLEAFGKRSFQACYTYLFGVYATFLHLKTGNIMAPIITHSVCNCLGLPSALDSAEWPRELPQHLRLLLPLAHFLGFFAWLYFLPTLTHSDLYNLR